MRHFVLAAAILGMVLLGFGVAAQGGYVFTGRIGATEQEAQEGYFALDGETMIVVRPGSPMHAYLRSRIGQRVRVTIEPARESE